MKIMTSTEIKNHFGDFVEAARREPVVMTQHGRRVFMAMPIEEAEELRALRESPTEPKLPAKPMKRNLLFELAGKGRQHSIYKSAEDIDRAIRQMRDEGP
jgi:prevent-host-death family protein